MLTSRLRSATTALFHFLLLTTPFIFTWVNEELFEFNKMLFVYGVATLIVGIWVMRMFNEKRIIIKHTTLDFPIFLFLLSQILSTIFSIHPRTSIFGYYTRFNGGLLSTFTYIGLFYAFVSNIDKKQIKSLLISLLLGGVLVSFYAIPEHFSHSPSCLLITGQFNVDCWIQDVQNRVFASFGQPNWLAAYTITLIPATIAIFFNKKAQKLRGFFLTTAGLLFATTLFTKSRSGQLGLGAGLLAFVIGGKFIWGKFSTTLSKLKKPVAVFTIIALLFGTILTPSLKEIWQKINSKYTTNTPTNSTLTTSHPAPQPQSQISTTPLGGTDSGKIRKIVWQGAFKIWQRYPLFGSGVETFAYSYYQDRPIAHNLVSEWDFLYNKAHNEFLNFLATTGVVGLVTYLFFLGSYLWQSFRFVFKNHDKTSHTPLQDDKFLVLGLASGVIALSISNFFGFSTVMVSLLLFIFPGIFAVLTKPQKPQKTPTNNDFSFFNYLGVFSTLIVSLFLIAAIFRVWQADRLFSKGKNLVKNNNPIDGITKIQEAITYSPREALFYDELANTYSKLAIVYAQANDATTSAQLAQAAIQTSDYTLNLNNRHLNFYKTRAKIFINLTQLNTSLLPKAKEVLLQALELSPTDAKLMYNLGLVELSLAQLEEKEGQAGAETLLKAIEMKPNYLAARLELAKYYEKTNQAEKAREQYLYLLNNVVPGNEEVKQRIEALDN